MCPRPPPTTIDTSARESRAGRASRLQLMSAVVLVLGSGSAAVEAAPSRQEAAPLVVETEHFRLEAPPELRAALAQTSEMVEPAYQALAATLDHSLSPGTVVRLWSETDARPGVDPTSQSVDGVLVPRLQVRGVLDLRLPAAMDRQTAAIDENLRLLLAAQLLAAASNGKLPPGLQLGAARYLQPPGAITALFVARMRESLADPPSWSALNRPGAEYEEPLLHQAWSLSMVHFLLQRGGFGSFDRFLADIGSTDGWRSALSDAFGEDTAALEAAWRAGLAGYVNGGWQEHLLYSFDLQRAEDRLAAGDFRGAAAQVRGSLGFLESHSPEKAASAGKLLRRAEEATRARGDLQLGLSLLDSGAHRPALAAANAAVGPLEAVGDGAGVAQAREIARRAERGLEAHTALQRSRALPWWRSVQAVLLARFAARQLAALGDEVGAREAARWAHERSLPAGALGALLAIAGVILLGANLRARRRARWLAA